MVMLAAQLQVEKRVELKRKIARKKKILNDLIYYLKMLQTFGITLEEFIKENPFSKIAFNRPNCRSFFNAVKLGEESKVKKYLMKDRYLIYAVDSVSSHFNSTVSNL